MRRAELQPRHRTRVLAVGSDSVWVMTHSALMASRFRALRVDALRCTRVSSGQRHAAAHAPTDGALLWSRDLSDRSRVRVAAGQNTASDTVVIHHTFPGALLGLDVMTGEERWRYDDELLQDLAMLADGVVLYRGEGNRSNTFVQAVDPTTGAPRWRRDFDDYLMRDMTIAGDTLYAQFRLDDDTTRVSAIDAATGATRWALERPLHRTRVVADASRVYAVDANDVMLALDAATAEVVWERPLPDSVRALDTEFSPAGESLLLAGHDLLDHDGCH